MGTAAEVIETAKSQLGVYENPPGSNKVLYNNWYYGRPVEGPAYPWCMVFVQWVFNKAKVPLPMRTPSCSALMNAAKEKDQFIKRDYQPGDVLLYSFTGSGWPSHTGIMVRYDSKNHRYIAIEGNTSNINQTNGGEVMEKSRRLSNIVGAVRPKFTSEKEGEEDMDASKLTDKEAFELLQKASNYMKKQNNSTGVAALTAYQILQAAMGYADNLPLPAWANQNGSWKTAMEKGIITVDTPEGLVRRDELTTILKRLDLL